MTSAPHKFALSAGVLLALLAGGFAGAGLAAAESAPETDRVTIDNFTFTPPTLTISAGTTVTWTNRDDIPHTVLTEDRRIKSGALDTDDAFSFKFDAAGTYNYFCSIHPKMTGTIVVTP